MAMLLADLDNPLSTMMIISKIIQSLKRNILKVNSITIRLIKVSVKQMGGNELIGATGDILRVLFGVLYKVLNGISHSIISSISSKLVHKIFNVINNGMFYSKYNQFHQNLFIKYLMLSTMACFIQNIINFNKKVSNSTDLAST
jgi:hypothetical protein